MRGSAATGWAPPWTARADASGSWALPEGPPACGLSAAMMAARNNRADPTRTILFIGSPSNKRELAQAYPPPGGIETKQTYLFEPSTLRFPAFPVSSSGIPSVLTLFFALSHISHGRRGAGGSSNCLGALD